MDDFDSWLSRLQGPAHRCAVIFVDNSGFDIILGIFPFVRELVSRGTKVGIQFTVCQPVIVTIGILFVL